MARNFSWGLSSPIKAIKNPIKAKVRLTFAAEELSSPIKDEFSLTFAAKEEQCEYDSRS